MAGFSDVAVHLGQSDPLCKRHYRSAIAIRATFHHRQSRNGPDAALPTGGRQKWRDAMTKPYPTSSVFSFMATSFGTSTSLFSRLVVSRRRRLEQERMAQMYNELIEHADEHILKDLGITRDDLFRLRAKLHE
jgi:uncharacterized protein YjiS (DUF1127 family)